MDVTQIPFNHLVGVKRVESPGGGLELKDAANLKNHLGTVHASAQFALAEASSGDYLAHHFKEFTASVIPVVRSVEAKFKKAATGRLHAKAQVPEEDCHRFVSDLTAKGRAAIGIDVEILDTNGAVTMNARFNWFVQKAKS